MKFEIAAKYDVIVVGSGISGLICAFELAKQGQTVCIISKEAITEGSSLYAQGGISVPIGSDDSVNKHVKDTLAAGAGLCDPSIVSSIIGDASACFEKLLSYGIKFDLDERGEFHQTREAAHKVARVCHIGGDATGRFITKILIDKVCRQGGISVSQGTFVHQLIKDDENSVCGVLVSDITKNSYVLLAKIVIFATGGNGQLYSFTSNPSIATGDGIAAAYKAGSVIQDIEMIQFHPTVLLGKQGSSLITEAIRGEGARLRNIKEKFFACNYSELGELAPRDVLARAIETEMRETNSEYVYLDLSNFDQKYFAKRFPTIFQLCIEGNIDLFGIGIPVAPAAHYSIGGIKSDLNGRTNLKGLYAVGEVASSGLHGANRLASNSLLECIVVPHLLVKDFLESNIEEKESFYLHKDEIEINVEQSGYDEILIQKKTIELKKRNWVSIGLTRSRMILEQHLGWLENLHEEIGYDQLSLDHKVQELKNMVLVSSLICKASIVRNYSLGVHFREDCLVSNTEFKHSLHKLGKGLHWSAENLKDKFISFSS